MNGYARSYFCYFCGGNQTGESLNKCKHFICKNCGKNQKCLICNGILTLNQSNNDRNHNTSKKRKFKDISNNVEEDKFNEEIKEKRKINLTFNKVIDNMMNDFELLDYTLIDNDYIKKSVLNQDKENYTSQKLKRNKFF